MIEGLIIFVFIMGYLGIALEHPAKIDKTAPALFMGMTCWAIFALWGQGIDSPEVIQGIQEHHGWLHFMEHELIAMQTDEKPYLYVIRKS